MLIQFAIPALFLTIAAIQDLRKGEIENWVSASLVISLLVLNLILSWTLFLNSLISLAIFFVLGWAFYYFELFEAGDAKLLMALGAAIPPKDILGFLSTFASITILFLMIVALPRIFLKQMTYREAFHKIRIAPVYLLSYAIYFF